MILNKLLITVFVLFVFWYKPFFTIILMFLIFAEYLYAINYIFNLYKNRNTYFKISIDVVDYSNMDNLEIWIEYCKLEAFQRVYLFLSKKNIRILNVISFSFSFIFSTFIKLLKVLLFFIFKNKTSLRGTLIYLYKNSYHLIKDSKIEILNNEIYLD